MDVPGLVKSHCEVPESFIRRPLRGRWPSRFSWSVDRMIWRWSPTTFQHPLPWTRHLFQASPVPSRAQLGGRGAGETIFSWNIRVPQNDRTQCFQDTMDWYYGLLWIDTIFIYLPHFHATISIYFGATRSSLYWKNWNARSPSTMRPGQQCIQTWCD